jgi:hypothetical protein
MWNNRARSNIEIFQIDSEMERATCNKLDLVDFSFGFELEKRNGTITEYTRGTYNLLVKWLFFCLFFCFFFIFFSFFFFFRWNKSKRKLLENVIGKKTLLLLDARSSYWECSTSFIIYTRPLVSFIPAAPFSFRWVDSQRKVTPGSS